jgi:hypothetical protein
VLQQAHNPARNEEPAVPNTTYSLPDGTKLTIEMPISQVDMGHYLTAVTAPETWTRAGWIECCGVSARKLVDSNLGVDVRFRRSSSDMYDVKIVEEVTDTARKQELMAQATEYYNRNTIRYGNAEYNTHTGTVSYSPLDARITNGEFTGNMVY